VIGTTIGNYVVRDKIGEGGMGVVYVAEHPRIGRKVAIKVLLPEYSQNEEVVQRFFTEARASSAIKNEHIIDIIDFGELPDKSSYIIMEWLEGNPLTSVLEREGKLAVDRALHVARGMGRALAAAHGRGIVHRDLKPDNVFLVVRGEDPDFAKVLDFGIAKLLGNEGAGAPKIASKTRTGAIIGTPMYMSPEQCRGVAVDERSDIYSFAVIVYQMLCGRVPFEAEGLGELLLKHMTEPPPAPRSLNPAVPESVERAILRALEKDPAQRYRRVEDFVAELGGQTVAMPAARPTQPLPPAPVTALSAAASQTDTIGGAVGETVMAPAGAKKRTNPIWMVGPALALGGVALAIWLHNGPAPATTSQPPSGGVTQPAAQPPKAEVRPAQPVAAPQDPPPPARVRLAVRTTTPGARILVDGKEQANPYGEDLPNDGRVYDVEVSAPGYATYREKVTLDQPRTVVPALVAERPTRAGKERHASHGRLPAAPPGTPDPAPVERPAAKSDAPGHVKAEARKSEAAPKDDKGAPIYKGTKGKLITDFPGD
jgi:eukaryotic-like serine/threonine-protein kinase